MFPTCHRNVFLLRRYFAYEDARICVDTCPISGLYRQNSTKTCVVDCNIAEDTYSDNMPDNQDKCAICLETFEDVSGNIIITVNCNHYFHRGCLREWFKRRLTCPYCNVNLAARHIEDNH